MDVNNLITQIVFDGTKSYIITKDEAVIERLKLDRLTGKPNSKDMMVFDLSQFNILVITEHKQNLQGLYFQLNTQTPTEKKPEPEPKKPDKKESVISTEKANKATKTESLHHKPQEVKTVIMRLKKKPTEEDIWND